MFKRQYMYDHRVDAMGLKSGASVESCQELSNGVLIGIFLLIVVSCSGYLENQQAKRSLIISQSYEIKEIDEKLRIGKGHRSKLRKSYYKLQLKRAEIGLTPSDQASLESLYQAIDELNELIDKIKNKRSELVNKLMEEHNL